MITNLRRRTAMAAAGLGAALGLGILLVPTVDAHLANGSMSEVMMSEIAGLPIPPIIHYGAIAYAPSGASGKAWHQRTPARAEQVALKSAVTRLAKWLVASPGAARSPTTARNTKAEPDSRAARQKTTP